MNNSGPVTADKVDQTENETFPAFINFPPPGKITYKTLHCRTKYCFQIPIVSLYVLWTVVQ